MKLSAARVERTLNQFDAEPIPDNHPAMASALLRPGTPTSSRYVGASVRVSNSTEAFSTRDVACANAFSSE